MHRGEVSHPFRETFGAFLSNELPKSLGVVHSIVDKNLMNVLREITEVVKL